MIQSRIHLWYWCNRVRSFLLRYLLGTKVLIRNLIQKWIPLNKQPALVFTQLLFPLFDLLKFQILFQGEKHRTRLDTLHVHPFTSYMCNTKQFPLQTYQDSPLRVLLFAHGMLNSIIFLCSIE